MLSSSQLIILLAIHQNNIPNGTIIHKSWWADHEVVQDRHQLYRLGRIDKARRTVPTWGQYELTEKGQAMVTTLLNLGLPEKQEVKITKWVVPGLQAA